MYVTAHRYFWLIFSRKQAKPKLVSAHAQDLPKTALNGN